MNIYESITKIMEEVPSIGKTQKNKTQGFMYRGIDDVMNALQPLLAKNKSLLFQKYWNKQEKKGQLLKVEI